MDKNEFQFGVTAYRIAENELAASFSEDAGEQFLARLYQEFLADPNHSDADHWLRQRLPTAFACAGSRPLWVEPLAIWPFHDGQPMIFIAQTTVPKGEVAQRLLSPEATLYIFGVRAALGGGWEMHYRVVQQLASLRGDVVA